MVAITRTHRNKSRDDLSYRMKNNDVQCLETTTALLLL